MKNMKLQYKVLMWTWSIIIVLSLIFTAMEYSSQKNALLEGIDNKLFTAAIMLKSALPADYHDNLNKESLSPEEYDRQIVDRNNKLCLDLELQYLWSCMVVGKDIVFTTSTSPGKDVTRGDHAGFFEVHRDPHAFDGVFGRMKPDYSSFHNEWGHGRMVLVPYIDENGRPYCFGASIGINDIIAQLRQTLIRSGVICVSALFIGFIFSILFAKYFTKPIVKLTRIAEDITKGQMDHDEEVGGSVEISSLSKSINAMSGSIKKTIEDLQTIQKKLAKAQDIALLSNFDWDIRADKISFSDMGCKMLGLESGKTTLTEEEYMRFIHPEDKRFFTNKIREWLTQCSGTCVIEHRIMRSDGEVRTVFWQGELSCGVEGKAEHVFGVIQDISRHKQMEEELRESEKKFRLLVENMQAGLIVHAPDTGIIYCNRRSSDIFGMSLEQMMGKKAVDPVWRFIDSNNNELPLEQHPVNLVLSRQQPVSDMIIGLKNPLSQEICWVMVNAYPLLDRNNRIQSVSAMFLDVTKRIRAKQEKQRFYTQLETYQRLVEFSGDGVYRYTTKEGKLLFANQGLVDMLDLDKTPADITGSFMKDLIIYTEKPGVIRKAVSEKGEIHNFEYHFKTLKGDDRWVLHNSFEMDEKYNGGTVVEAIVKNITEHKKFGIEREKFIQELQKKTAELEKARDELAQKAQELEALNEELEVSNEELQTRGEELESTNEELQVSNEELEETTSDLQQAKLELEGLTNDLEKKVQERTKELTDAHEKLIQSEKLAIIGQLAGSIAHELRTPLGAIKGATYFLESKLADVTDNVDRRYFSIIEAEINASDRVITDVLAFGSVKPPVRVETDLDALVGKVLETQYVPYNIDPRTELDKNLPHVLVDDFQITQVLKNVITNAIQSMKDGGELTVKSSVSGEFVMVSVADTGEGIPEDNIKKIFDPMFSTKIRGVGLGLAICKTIIDMHNGYIEVESKVKEGTSISIMLPLEYKKT